MAEKYWDRKTATRKGNRGESRKKAVMEIRRYPEDFTEPCLCRRCCLWENKTDACAEYPPSDDTQRAVGSV